MSDDKIKPIGVRYQKPDDKDTMLTLIDRETGECLDHAYLIDKRRGIVSCKRCKKQFDPMFVLSDLARVESRFMQNHEAYEERMRRLSERERTKCDHCGEMTRISR